METLVNMILLTRSLLTSLTPIDLILPHAGTVKLFTYGEIASYGSYDDAEIKFDILDKYGNDLQTYNTLVGFPGYPGFGIAKI
jgi:hypothetical protein